MKIHYTGTWKSIRRHQVPQWYHDCKFGIFVHWGIYSVPAYAPRTWELGEVPCDENWFCNNPYAEWYYNSLHVGEGPTYEHHIRTYGKDFRYEDFIPLWKAENWDPTQWADLFRRAGARYVVLTTKHHDGYCLFDSAYTDFNSAKMSPGRDITAELTEAVREAGLRMGLYYSAIIDWQFANDPIYTEEQNHYNSCPTAEYGDYSYRQMKELIDKYHPSILWNDIGWPRQSEHMMPYLLAHYYNTVEEGVTNDRYNGLYHDFLTREYQYGRMDREEKWEMCRGMGLSFGYNQEEGEDQLIGLPKLINLLVGTVANNGNLLLNIGPKADGTIPPEQVSRLLTLGKWLEVNGEGIYGTRCSRRESQYLEGGREIHFTKKEKDLYLFLDGLQEGANTLVLPKVRGRLEALHGELRFQQEMTEKGLMLTLHNYRPDMYAVGFRGMEEV